jgi:hypothetical protein
MAVDSKLIKVDMTEDSRLLKVDMADDSRFTMAKFRRLIKID